MTRHHSWLHPITRKRLRRFRALRRAWWSFWLLAGAYGVSLFSELLCNEKPLYVSFEGRSFFPVLRYYSERDLLGAGNLTRADFKAIRSSARFRDNPDNRMIFPLIPYGPLEIMRTDSIAVPDEVTVKAEPAPHLGTVDVDADLRVVRGVAAGFFFGVPDGVEAGALLPDAWTLPPDVRDGVFRRLRNEASPAAIGEATREGGGDVEVSLPPFSPRSVPPRTVRVTLRERVERVESPPPLVCRRDFTVRGHEAPWWTALNEAQRTSIRERVGERFNHPVEPLSLQVGDQRWRLHFEREDVRFPFRPVAGHPLGIDSAGRDVAARLLYGLRISMTFGMILVVASMIVGTMIGAAQGYHGGAFDIVGQRLTEIWDSLPFLYILILMGSVYGRSFGLLLLCYGIFNWIGISYYMRAEFLRLRHQTYVEAARALGLPAWKIMFQHILPNALVPIVTFFPFSLVSAIGVLAALDYLGFGLPPPTASWGEMLAQAQAYSWAWWLTVYPSLALFLVMLLGVFVGEGVRSAFDPKQFSRME